MEDEDMIVIIVGDESEDNHQALAMSAAVSIKEESVCKLEQCDLNPESILETAELHGEYISLTKEERYDCEYLEDDLEEEIIPSKSKSKVSSSPVKKQLSYIDQLRKNFPKMRKDENYLIAHLADVMRNTKAPPPPANFCSDVNGALVCKFCNAKSLSLPKACRHYQKMHGSRVFVCFACGSNYKCTTGLYKHEKRCQASGAKLVLKARGQYLGRKGRQRPYLTRNKFDPGPRQGKDPKNNNKPTTARFFCSQCTASFKYKDAMRSHEFLHNGIRPYKCRQCPLAYTSAVGLRRHVLIHKGAEYICDTCKRSFNIKNTLITHMNTHLPQRKYPCDQCERRFAQKYALRNHIDRDHLHIPPPFACTACPKRFPRMSNLKAHMKARHGLTVMTHKMFVKALPSMKESELKQATLVINQLDNKSLNAPIGEPIFNDYDFDEHNSADDPSSDSDSEVQKLITVEIVPVNNENEEDIFGFQHFEPQEGIEVEEIDMKDHILLTPEKANVTIEDEGDDKTIRNTQSKEQKKDCDVKKKGKPKPKWPKIDLSFVKMHTNEQDYNGRRIRNIDYMDMPILTTEIKNESLRMNNDIKDVGNYIVVNENECKVTTDIKKERLKQSPVVVEITDESKNINNEEQYLFLNENECEITVDIKTDSKAAVKAAIPDLQTRSSDLKNTCSVTEKKVFRGKVDTSLRKYK